MAASRLFVCVLVSALMAVPGFAQPVGRRPVAIVNLDLAGDRELVDFAQAIGAALETHPALRPNGMLAPLYERIDDPDADKLAFAQKKMNEALADLGNGNFESAARAARDGQIELWSVTPTQAVLLYAELAFIRGKALVGDGKSTEAGAQFSLSQRLDPTRQIDIAREPPDIVAAYNAAKSAPAPTGRVSIENIQGSVWLDGNEEGFAPNQYVVTSGLHVVWVTDRDRATSGVEIDVKPGQVTPAPVPERSASPTLKLQRARQELARAPDDGAKMVAMKHLAKTSGVKDAVVLSRTQGKIFYQTWRSDDADRTPGFSPKHERKPTDLPVKVLEDLLPPQAEVEPPGVVFPIPIDDKRWYQKPAYWAGIGFGASVLAAGAYFLISTLLPDSFRGPSDLSVVDPQDRITR